MNPKIGKRLFWRKSGDSWLASALHLPRDATNSGLGVLICPPLGHEHVHAFRSFRSLADKLAATGIPTVRFEYRGTGNSTGGSEDCRVDNWVSDIEMQLDGLKRELDLNHMCLVGFRFGALLASAAAGERDDVSVVSWASITKPGSYVRELKAISRLSGYAPTEGSSIECGGFVYPEALIEDILSINERISTDANDPIVFALDAGDDSFSSEDYESMLLEPHYADIPEGAIAVLLEKIGSLANDSEGRPPQESQPAGDEASYSQDGIHEELVLLEDQAVAGIRCRATAQQDSESTDRVIVILSNAGSVHSMGPNRIYAILARTLAADGFDSFRFDLPNLGESVVSSAEHENEPYYEGAPEAISDVVEICKTSWGYDKVIVAGLCSGSYNGFLTALNASDRGLSGLVMINPLTFHWEPGMPFRLGAGAENSAYAAKHFASAASNRSSWVKFLTGKADYLAIARFVLERVGRLFRTTIGKLFDITGLAPPSPLAQQLEMIAGKDIPLHFIFSSRDPGYELLQDGAKSRLRQLIRDGAITIETVHDADHTFSQSQHRAELQKLMLSVIRKLS